MFKVITCACVIALCPTIGLAQTAFTYNLIVEANLDDGQVIDLPALPVSDFSECKYQKSKTQVGRKFGKNMLVFPDGRSHTGTIIGARCEPRSAPQD